MKIQKILLLLFFISTYFTVSSQTNSKNPNIKLPEIAKELIAMRDEDQKYRRKWGKLVRNNKRNTKKFKKTSIKLRGIDLKNTARLKQIVEQYGWPTYDLVGKHASRCAWVVTQHADMNPLFQQYCLPLLKEAVDNQQADPSNYAYLYDRVQNAKSEKQLYATQSTTNNGLKTGHFQPIDDESNVQKRRTEMGIKQPIETYAKDLGFEYTIPSKEEAIERDNEWDQKYQTNIELGNQAMKVKDYDVAIKHYGHALEAHGYVKAVDYVQWARVVSISNHKNCSGAYYFLMKAALKGCQEINEFDTDEDFKNIKLANPSGWSILMNLVEELNEK